MILEISSPLECRAEGRRLIGPAIQYGDISDSHRERFEPGAFILDDATRWLNYRHEPDRVLAFTNGGGLRLRDEDNAVMVYAELPKIPLADHALAEVRAGKLKGFSVEFRAVHEKREDDIRIIEQAELAGIGLVDEPSYRGSQAELRARSGRTMRSRIPSEKNLSCRCSGAACKFARFAQGAVDEMLDKAFDGAANTIATWTDYSRPLASVRRGTLRRAGNDSIEIDVPTGAAGDAVLAASEDAGVIIRPFLDSSASESFIQGETAIYTRARARAFIVSSSDESAGWPAPEFIPTPEPLIRTANRPSEVFLWL